MFTSMTARLRVSTNMYCLARTRRFSRRTGNSVGRVTHEREAPTDVHNWLELWHYDYSLFYVYVTSFLVLYCMCK